MKIELKRLTGTNTVSIPFSDTIDLSKETLYGQKPFKHPVRASGIVTNELGVLRLRGTAKAIYSTACARCLKPLDILLTAEVDTILTDDPEAVEDDDLFVVEGESVDTAEVMVPALLLQVQMTYLCREDCKGICPHCGADRNEVECGCEKQKKGPLFEVLRGLVDTDDKT